MVHGVVEGLGLRHPRTQLPGLLLRQATHELPAARARLVVLRHRRRRGLEVVGLPRPPQQRRPPPAALRRPSRADHPSGGGGGGARTDRRRRPRRRRAGGQGNGGDRCARCHRHSDRPVASFSARLCFAWVLRLRCERRDW